MQKFGYWFEMKSFLKIESILKECYGIDRNTISNDIAESVNLSEMGKDPAVEKYRSKTDTGTTYEVFSYAMENLTEFRIPIYESFNPSVIIDFCEANEIYSSDVANTLIFIYVLSERAKKGFSTESDEEFYRFNEYVSIVRPEMLKLYMEMHKQKKLKPCTISFGNSEPITIDNHVHWFKEAVDEYLTKYLGVSSLDEAKEEYLANYGKKSGIKLNEKVARYMWGTYFLLQTIPAMKSPKERSVTNKQSRIIADLLLRIGLLNDPIKYDDGKIVRSQLNYYLKKYKTLDEFIAAQKYKTSPNNKDSWKRYF